MFVNNINPVLFSIGPFGIRFYGIVYVIGFLLGYYLLHKAISKKKLNITYDELDKYFLWIIIISMLMSRIFEVFIYNYSEYTGHLMDFFKIWNGGLSIQGGLIGAIIVTLIFCYRYKHKVKFYEIADILVLPTALTLAIGKVANYINSELYGTITNPQSTPWCVIFQRVDTYCRHPVQIYESILYLALFILLLIYYLRHNTKKTNPRARSQNIGTTFWIFIIGFSIIRFTITFLRDEPTYIGLNVGQWISLATIIISSTILIYLWKYKSKSI